MKAINVTKDILALRQDAYFNEITQQVNEEIEDGFTQEELEDAQRLIASADTLVKPKRSNVIGTNFGAKKSRTVENRIRNESRFEPFGEFELLAAAAKDSDVKWYEQIITVGAREGKGGCVLEINPYGDDGNNIKITLSAMPGNEGLITQMLGKFAGQDVNVEIMFEGKSMLSAEIYVTPEANLAEGLGTLQQSDRPDTKYEKIQIGFKLKN
jgi:hypothetical protein